MRLALLGVKLSAGANLLSGGQADFLVLQPEGLEFDIRDNRASAADRVRGFVRREFDGLPEAVQYDSAYLALRADVPVGILLHVSPYSLGLCYRSALKLR